jgi:hypothetical protein
MIPEMLKPVNLAKFAVLWQCLDISFALIDTVVDLDSLLDTLFFIHTLQSGDCDA